MSLVVKMQENVRLDEDETLGCYQLIHKPTEKVLATRDYGMVKKYRRPGLVMRSIARRAMKERGLS